MAKERVFITKSLKRYNDHKKATAILHNKHHYDPQKKIIIGNIQTPNTNSNKK